MSTIPLPHSSSSIPLLTCLLNHKPRMKQHLPAPHWDSASLMASDLKEDQPPPWENSSWQTFFFFFQWEIPLPAHKMELLFCFVYIFILKMSLMISKVLLQERHPDSIPSLSFPVTLAVLTKRKVDFSPPAWWALLVPGTEFGSFPEFTASL